MNVSKGKFSGFSKHVKEKLTKSETIETIFDHNPTEEELEHFTWGIMSKEDYLKEFDKDVFYEDIYRLYNIRKNKDLAEKYYLMISKKIREKKEEIRENRIIDIIRVEN